MNLGEVIAAAERQSGRTVSFEWGRQLVNDALARVSTKRDWPWLEVTQDANPTPTTNTVEFTRIYVSSDPVEGVLPTDKVLRVRQFLESTDDVGTSWREVRGVSLRELLDTSRLQFGGGESRLWALHPPDPVSHGVLIRVEPAITESKMFRIVYTRSEPELVSASEVPFLPSQFHPYLVAYVVERVHRRHGETQRAVEARVEAEQVVREMLDDAERVAGPFRVRVRPGGGL